MGDGRPANPVNGASKADGLREAVQGPGSCFPFLFSFLRFDCRCEPAVGRGEETSLNAKNE